MEVIELKSKKELSNVKLSSYKGLERYLQDKGCLYTKQIIVNPTNNYSVDMKYLTKDGLNILTSLVNNLERDEDVLKQLVQSLYVATKTYGKPFEITIDTYVNNLRIYPIECLKEVLDPKSYNEFPTLLNILNILNARFPIVIQAIEPKKELFKVEE